MSKKFFEFIIAVLLLSSCSHENKHTDPKDKFQVVLDRYKNDSLKLKAARFLIDNMDIHYTIINSYLNPEGVEYTGFIASYSGPLMEDDLIDSLHLIKEVDTIWDVDQVTPEYLIKNIDQAFEVYENPVLKHKPSFENFCEYVLPYRVRNERLEEWRDYFRKRYTFFLEEMHPDSLTIYNAVNKINVEISCWQRFKNTYAIGPFHTSSISELLKYKTYWTCSEIIATRGYIYRSIGLATACEDIPYWGRGEGGHLETSALFEDNMMHAACWDSTWFKTIIGKMYRETFSRQPNQFNLIKDAGEHVDDIPIHFNSDNRIDVTKERDWVSDINLTIPGEDKKKVYYLCVYNSGAWVPVQWSEYYPENNTVHFKEMSRRVMYHLAYSNKRRMELIGQPFALETDGSMRYLSGNDSKKMDAIFTHSSRHDAVIADSSYRLFIWNNAVHNWKELTVARANDMAIFLKGIPVDGLYTLQFTGNYYKNLRPFIFKNGIQSWW